MIDEILYMEIRLLDLFCHNYDVSSVQANRLFNNYGIWDYIEECYDTLHMSGDEYILSCITDILTVKGVQLILKDGMILYHGSCAAIDKIRSTANLILTMAIQDYSAKMNLSKAEVRNQMIESGAYDALYDPETGLWTQGPDYFTDFFLRMKEKA